MQPISASDIQTRLERDNPWWSEPDRKIPEANSPRRVYFRPLSDLALDFGVRRATVLLGARRVGKTFMIKQLVAEAISSGINPRAILYVSVDTPIYSGFSLDKFLDLMPKDSNIDRRIVIFDEIQYLRSWEVYLKDLVDTNNNIKFIATGSAAASLRLKSKESGAGRFSDFMLPPLTFYEFLTFIKEDEALIEVSTSDANDDGTRPKRHHLKRRYLANNIDALNHRFIDYLNFGGYPEVVLNESIRKNPEQFIRNDIIDKVLLKDLPSLYGIQEIPELNRLFSFLAYNAGNEASLENITQESGITKPTIRRYIEYLESAFLIIKVRNVDDNCKTMKRERNFKIYLNNPSMRAALFTPVGFEDSDRIGHLTESAIFSQWQHAPSFRNLHYARWRNEGEVDIVHLAGPRQMPTWIGEIKWSDRVGRNQFDETKAMHALLKHHPTIEAAVFTTKTIQKDIIIDGRPVSLIPSALYCYTVGRNITTRLATPLGIEIEGKGRHAA